jgi:hypothetical protein
MYMSEQVPSAAVTFTAVAFLLAYSLHGGWRMSMGSYSQFGYITNSFLDYSLSIV